jgi:hypothetical protein
MIVKVNASFPGTQHLGWKVRRHNKCMASLLRCAALAAPMNGGLLVTADFWTTFGIDNYTYTVELPDSWTEGQIQLFARLAKQVKHFFAVDLTPLLPTDTIPPCTDPTHQRPATSATC